MRVLYVLNLRRGSWTCRRSHFAGNRISSGWLFFLAILFELFQKPPVPTPRIRETCWWASSLHSACFFYLLAGKTKKGHCAVGPGSVFFCNSSPASPLQPKWDWLSLLRSASRACGLVMFKVHACCCVPSPAKQGRILLPALRMRGEGCREGGLSWGREALGLSFPCCSLLGLLDPR